MYCSTCGKSVPTDAAFCSSCGSQTHSSPVNKSNDPEVTVLNEPVENQDGRKYTYIGIAVLILWFIAINPVDGNILDITHLDLAQSDCSSEEYVLTGDSEFDEFFADFDEEITASCKKQKSESMVIMLFGIIGIIYCYFAINRPAKSERSKELARKRKTAPQPPPSPPSVCDCGFSDTSPHVMVEHQKICRWSKAGAGLVSDWRDSES